MYLGVDLGTTGTKVALVDPSRGVVASATASVDALSPRPGWAEASPAQWWQNVCELIPQVLAQAGVRPADVDGIACSGMVPAVVVTDHAGNPRRAAILQSDARASREISDLEKLLPSPEEMLSRTGSALTQQSVAPTLLWLRRHEPDVLEGEPQVVGSYDWLTWRMGAPANVETNWALESGLFNLDGSLAADVWAAADADPSWVPQRRAPGDVVGSVSSAAARETGLLEGTPIVVGGADHVLSAYAAGLSEPGDWLVKLGGAGDILAVSPEAVLDPRLYLDLHPAPGLWMPNGCMATSGSLLRWWQRILGPLEPPSLEALDDEARTAAPAQLTILPYFLGEKSPLHDPELRGAVVGLHLGTTRGDLLRASLEAIGFGFRQHVDVFGDIGLARGVARVTNGGSRSRLWKEILASILNRPLVSIVDHPGASLGAAFLAAIGTGALEDWNAPRSIVQTDDPIEPDQKLVSCYEDAYRRYLDTAHALADISHDITRHQVAGSEP